MSAPTNRPSKLTTSSRIKKATLSARRSRLQIVSCPICNIGMSAVLLDSHIDSCRPRQRDPTPPPPCTFHACARSPPSHPIFSSARCTHNECADISQTFTVALRDNARRTKLHIAFQQPSAPVSFAPLRSDAPAERLPLSVLKSALQKCVRRSRSAPAMRIAVAMARKTGGLLQLLRRFTVIIIEDCVLCDGYDRLVWLLVASGRGYRACLADVVFVMGCVYRVAGARIRDAGAVRAGKGAGLVDETGDSLAIAMWIRSCYGGMKGDVDMLRRAGWVWQRRLEEDRGKWMEVLDGAFGDGVDERTVRLLMEDEWVLRKGDVLLEAFDFHCCAVGEEIAREIVQAGDEGAVVEQLGETVDAVRGEVERLMWRFRSGVSNKGVFDDVDGARSGGAAMIRGAMGRDELIWNMELAGRVEGWCRRYRERFGL